MKKITKKILIVFLTASIFFNSDTFAQGVGIGTSHPQATLHVAGNVRIDTALPVNTTKRIAVFDSLGVVRSFSFDSLKKQLSGVTVFSKEVNTQTSTTSNSPQARVTVNLAPGTYVLFFACEVFNTNVDAGARVWAYEGATEFAYSIVYSNTSTFGSWSTSKLVSPSVTTTYALSYASWPGGTTTHIRSARIIAIKIL